MTKITLERWEGNEYIICVNGKPTGGTLTEPTGENIKEWLVIALPELIKNLK